MSLVLSSAARTSALSAPQWNLSKVCYQQEAELADSKASHARDADALKLALENKTKAGEPIDLFRHSSSSREIIPIGVSTAVLFYVVVSDLTLSLEDARDQFQVAKRKNAAIIKVSPALLHPPTSCQWFYFLRFQEGVAVDLPYYLMIELGPFVILIISAIYEAYCPILNVNRPRWLRLH